MPFLVAVALLLAACGRRPESRLERSFAAEGKALVHIAYTVPADAVARGVLFDRETLRASALYLRAPGKSGGDFVYVAADGTIERNAGATGSVTAGGELLFTRDGTVTFFVDSRPVADGLSGWDIFWVSAAADAPATRNRVYPRVVFADGFMRATVEDGQCRIASGRWRLQQHGGGMATTDAELHDASFQRAANPFAAVGEGGGLLCFGDDAWFDFHGEARFYFGVPVEGNVVDTETLPAATDMLVVQGAPGAEQVAFGWRGKDRSFVLLGRAPGGDWQELARRTGPRPAVTTWMRLGLSVARGQGARAFLDGVQVLEAALPRKVTGPFGVQCGEGAVECDDVRVWSNDSAPEPGASLYARSTQFADKKRKEGSDPIQFDQWAQGADTFLEWRGTEGAMAGTPAVIANRVPILGDFVYECAAAGDGAGKVPEGLYEFRFAEVRLAPAQKPAADWEKAPALRARLAADGWRIEGAAVGNQPGRPVGTELRLRRRAADGNRLVFWTGSEWQPVTDPLAGPLRLMIGFHGDGTKPYPALPRPPQHRVTCTNLFNDFFEESPTDWSWVEGSFRMACRWACQDQWNFMACGSPGVPFMASKRTFGGKQFFECYLSLRPVYPWDAGDASFTYDPATDRNWEFFIAHEGWYNRHDLNFSFCSDGRNPLSGYAIVFGGDDNRETRLLRQGQIVARTSAPEFLFPVEAPHAVIHWRWWRFTIWKDGGHIQVDLNGARMLEYTDPAPLDEGHAAFWSVRNGFALSRATLMAEKIGWDPAVLYVEERATSAWQPRPADSATLASLPSGLTRVSREVGAGSFAVRYRFDPAADLAATPVLELPLSLAEAGTAVNLHLEIGGRSFLVEINAPLSGMKALLTPEFEHGECFRLPVMAESTVRERYLLGKAALVSGVARIDLGKALEAKGVAPGAMRLTLLTLGNTSNEGYRLVGGEGCNLAGAWFDVGTPRLVKRE